MKTISSQSCALDIKTTSEADKIKISIRNTHSSSNDTDKIFSEYYTTHAKGSGLGLAIIRKIVTLHGGQVWAESSVAENWFELIFSLPITNSEDNQISTIKLPLTSVELDTKEFR